MPFKKGFGSGELHSLASSESGGVRSSVISTENNDEIPVNDKLNLPLFANLDKRQLRTVEFHRNKTKSFISAHTGLSQLTDFKSAGDQYRITPASEALRRRVLLGGEQNDDEMLAGAILGLGDVLALAGIVDKLPESTRDSLLQGSERLND